MALRTPLTAQPHLYIGDSTGRPLDYGRVYFGEPNQDPEFYPIDIYLDPEMTIAAAQPVRTKGGFMDVGGNLAELHAAEVVYSLKVLDQYGRQVFYKPEMYRNNVSDFLVDEITRATAAETLIAGNLTAETQRAIAAEKVIADAVVTEKDRAIAAEGALDSKYATLDNTVAGIVNGRPTTAFATKALMEASELVDGDYAMVTDDATNNGVYVKTAGAWVKSGYSPVLTSYIDSNPLFKPQVIVSGDDFNNLTKAGLYTHPAGGLTSSQVTNAPYYVADKLVRGTLVVYNALSIENASCYQFFYPHNDLPIVYRKGVQSTGLFPTQWKVLADLDSTLESVAKIHPNFSFLGQALDALLSNEVYGKQFSESDMSGDGTYNGGYYVGYNETSGDKPILFNTVKARIYNTSGGETQYRVYLGDKVRATTRGGTIHKPNASNPDYSGVTKSFPQVYVEDAQEIQLDKLIAIPPNTNFIIVFRNTVLSPFGIGKTTRLPDDGKRGFSLATEALDWDDVTIAPSTSNSQAGFQLYIKQTASGDTAESFVPDIIMPPKIYALAGLQSHIYPEQLLIEDSDLYLHDISCPVGKQTKRGWLYDVPSDKASGTTDLGWALYDKQTMKHLASSSTSVVFANPAVSGIKKVLAIGSSSVGRGTMTQRMLDISATDALKITTVGTKGGGINKHEGRGGWRINDYVTEGRTYYSFTVSGVAAIPAINAAQYSYGGSIFRVQETYLTSGGGTLACELLSGTPPVASSSGTLTKINSSTGDETIAFSNVQPVSGNPFWFSGALNFGQYITSNSLETPDFVFIVLGVNTVFSVATDAAVVSAAATALAQHDLLINSIKAQNPLAKIGIVSSTTFADQDAFGNDYGCSYTSWRCKRNIMLWNKAMYEHMGGRESEGIYVVAAGANVDALNNFPSVLGTISSHNDTTIARQSDSVHLDVSGYKQVGDALFAFVKAVS